MNALRERLKIESLELFQALERSWEIAWNEWLPALGVKKDSYNSYPHLRNLKSYLDQVVSSFEPLDGAGTKPFLTSTELYILLSAILFHDIGRIPAAEEDSEQHAGFSEEIIAKQWNELGIQSIELAKSIGEICLLHDCEPTEWGKETKRLNKVVIDPYGEVRERLLACLLVLIDHLDGAFSRVMPAYIRSNREIKVVGAFRNVVRGVYVDPFCQMIRTVVSDNLATLTDEIKISDKSAFTYSINPHIPRKNDAEALYKSSNGNPFPDAKVKLSSQEITNNFPATGKPSTPSALELAVCNSQFTDQEWMVARQLLFLNKEKLDEKWPAKKLLAMVMGNIRENREALQLVKDDLAANGIPIRDWVIDFREHLYNELGGETFEPIFTQDYLCRVVKSMWKLSTTIFGSSYFTYENLADDLRDPQVERVKAAVHRIGIVDTEKEVIWTGDRNWKWLISNQSVGKVCNYIGQDTMCAYIKELQRPKNI